MFLTLLYGVVAVAQAAKFSGVQIPLAGGFSGPQSVAVDTSGDIFVADSGMVVLLLILLAGGAAVSGITGCGSGFFAQSPKSYDVTITVAAGALSHSTNVTLSVE